MHPIVVEYMANFHTEDLVAQADHARLARSTPRHASWRRRAARVAVAVARLADPTAFERLVAERDRVPARAH